MEYGAESPREVRLRVGDPQWGFEAQQLQRHFDDERLGINELRHPAAPLPRAIPDFLQPAVFMPYKRRKTVRRKSYKRRRGGPRMDAGARAILATYSKAKRRAAVLDGAATFVRAMGGDAGAGARVAANVEARRVYDVARGRGSYKFGPDFSNLAKGYTKFAKSGVGRQLRGIGADLLHKYTGIGLDGRGMYTGRGDYTDNSLIDDGLGVAEEVPSFNGSGDETGSILVSKKEYICDIYGPGESFNVQSFELNPGLESTFPWLSQIAQNYDEYDFKQLMFTYRSTTTDIGTTSNGQCGTCIMATNYNAAAPPFGDKVVMMEYDAAMSCKLTESMRHGIECDPNKLSGSEGKYVRNNPVVLNQDLKTYDHGLFQLGIANSPGSGTVPPLGGFYNQSVGELWVSYTVELRKPKFYASRGLGISEDIYVSNTGESILQPMGNLLTLLSGQQNNINCQITQPFANWTTITFPASYAGFIEIKFCMEGITSIGNSINAVTNTGNVQTVADMYGGSGGGSDNPHYVQSNTQFAIPAGGVFVFTYHIEVQIASGGSDNSVTFVTQNITVAPTQSSLTISEYNSGFSYKAQNIGPLGNQSVAPVLVTPQGVVVVP